jgi:hypothetical protein
VSNSLEASAVAVLAIVLEHLNRADGKSCPGCDRMAHITGLHRTTIMRAVEQLEAAGWLRVTRRPNRANEYQVPAWPTSSDWPAQPGTGSAGATGSADATGRTHAPNRSHPRTEPVAQVRPEPASNPVSNPEEQELSLALLAEPVLESQFDQFWKAYPRKIGSKEDARKIWQSKKLEPLADRIIRAVKLRALIDPDWQKENRKYVPYPAKYMRHQRWLDEWQVGALAHQPGESDADLLQRLTEEAEEARIRKLSAVDQVAAHIQQRKDRESVAAARNGFGTVGRYSATSIDDLAPELRAAVERELENPNA